VVVYTISMRLTRSQSKRAAKMRHRRHQKLRSTDGPCCPHCEPHVNGRLKRETHRARAAARQMQGLE